MYEEKDASDIKIKVCEICGEEKENVSPCRMCGVNFCDECGYPEKHLCFDCGDEVDESYDDEADETLEESNDLSD